MASDAQRKVDHLKDAKYYVINRNIKSIKALTTFIMFLTADEIRDLTGY